MKRETEIMLEHAARGESGSGEIRGYFILGDLTGLKYKLVCCLKLAVDIVEVASGSLYNTDRLAFLKRDLVG